MKYVVFTTKHHDGFCMFDSKYTDYKITSTECPFSVNPKANVAKEVFNAFEVAGQDEHQDSLLDEKYSENNLEEPSSALEKNLDILLINRENNKVSLTESGKVFLQYSERILALCEESCRALIDLKNGERGNLTVGASQTIGTYLLPRVLALFAQNYPQINLKIQVNSTRMIAKNVINREIDLAVVGGEIPNDLKKNLIIENFVDDEFVFLVCGLFS